MEATFAQIYGNKNDGKTTLTTVSDTVTDLNNLVTAYVGAMKQEGHTLSSVVITLIYPPKEGDWRNG